VAAIIEVVVVGAAGAEDVAVEAAAVPVVEDTRLDFVLFWQIAGIVAVAARRMKLAVRSFICSPLGVKGELEIFSSRRSRMSSGRLTAAMLLSRRWIRAGNCSRRDNTFGGDLSDRK
jgi:hypothetical protein